MASEMKKLFEILFPQFNLQQLENMQQAFDSF